MGFGDKWIDWLRRYFAGIKTSVLVNGAPTEEFSPSRGLRQGDPLSPLLFNLVAEVLNKLLLKANQIGLFSGVKFSEEGNQLTHLQFADDTILFIKGNEEAFHRIKSILQVFQLLSGMRINFSKSNVFCCNKNPEWARSCSSILECNIGSWPLIYLGVPIGISPERKVF